MKVKARNALVGRSMKIGTLWERWWGCLRASVPWGCLRASVSWGCLRASVPWKCLRATVPCSGLSKRRLNFPCYPGKVLAWPLELCLDMIDVDCLHSALLLTGEFLVGEQLLIKINNNNCYFKALLMYRNYTEMSPKWSCKNCHNKQVDGKFR